MSALTEIQPQKYDFWKENQKSFGVSCIMV